MSTDYLKLAREARARSSTDPVCDYAMGYLDAGKYPPQNTTVDLVRGCRELEASATALCDAIEAQAAEIERLKHNSAAQYEQHEVEVQAQAAEIERLRTELADRDERCTHEVAAESPAGVKQCAACGKTSYRGERWKGGWKR